MPRRLSTTLRVPRRDHLFSADDDTAEVEADAFRRRIVGRRKSAPPGFVPSEHQHVGQTAPSGIPRLELTEAPDEPPVQDDAEVDSDAGSFTLKLRQQAINETHPFGIRLWKPALYQQGKPPEDDESRDIHSIPGQKANLWSLLFNILWTVLFGWWLAVLAATGGLVCIACSTSSSREYGRALCGLARYLFYPFGKLVRLETDDHLNQGRSMHEYEQWQNGSLNHGHLFFGSRQGQPTGQSPMFGRGQWNSGKIVFFPVLYLFIIPPLFLASIICWALVFTIPMAKTCMHLLRGNSIFLIDLMGIALIITLNWLIQKLLHVHTFTLPLSLLFPASLLGIIPLAYFIGQAVASISAQSSMGVSAVVNAFFSTIFEVLFYCVALKQGKSRLVEGCIIGSIFAGVLFLPGLSMCFGALKRKTQRFNSKSAGVTSTMLLFAIIGVFSPTLFYAVYGTHVMRCGGCFYKPTQSLTVNSQRSIASCRTCSISQELDLNEDLYVHVLRPFSYSCAALLLLAYVIGLLFTLRTHAAVIWAGDAEDKKHQSRRRESVTTSLTQGRPAIPIGAPFESRRHSFTSHRGSIRSATTVGSPRGALSPLSYPLQRVEPEVQPRNLARRDCDILPELPEEDGAQDGTNRASSSSTDAQVTRAIASKDNDWHSVPNWSRTKSLLILLGSTILYGILANIIIEMVDSILKEVHVDEKFVGLTIFALVPNTTEIWNAILFATNGNIALSMEIGSAYVLQVCLLQIPALVFFSAVFHSQPGPHEDLRNYVFPLVFPQWDMVLVVICVFLLGYLYGEGKSNYFKGSILLLAYVVVVAGFYFSGV
ncbi:Sodium/calcium exchanger protein-domain-containing protein [Fusarium solani]|uniref:Sodium/calcium exchanger protein-domain-containing protein n=1 Tax=Fusarium solani TaxID=169388 RepID=A0A9P9GT29_FUSSL|nr:Sodium/calcium exchanger protein-domain-containing protein [Fusarium solani]KAH7244960.1 Sodium/calcium exchanger protein-domain-containing protein [Fusarium solani]